MYRRYFRFHTAGLLLTCLCYLGLAAEGSIMAGLSRYIVDDVLEINLTGKPVLEAKSKPPVTPAHIELVNRKEPIAWSKQVESSSLPGDASAFAVIGQEGMSTNGSLQDRIAARRGKTAGEKIRLLIIIAVFLATIHLLAVGMQTWSNIKLGLITEQVIFRMRRHIHDKLLKLQMSFHDQYQTGRLLSRATDDVNVIQNVFAGIMVQLTMFLGLIIINTSIMFYIHAPLALLTLLAMPFYAIVYHKFRRKIRELSISQRKQNAEIYGFVRDRLANPRIIKGFGQEKREQVRFFTKAKKFFRFTREINVRNHLLAMLSTCISVLVTALVIGYGTILLKNGALSLGYLLFFYSISYALFWPIAALSQLTAQVQRIRVSCDRILGILDEPVKIYDNNRSRKITKFNDSLVIENLSFTYDGNSETTLKDINLSIPAGQKVCLMGTSGAGKSTLGMLLLRLYDPSEGKILIDGTNFQDVKISSIRERISFVPQEPLLFSGTLANNILYANPRATREDMVRAAKLADIHEFIESLRDGYNTTIGENGLRLSGGQKQRIGLARALVTDPDILILDDCTSALDAATEAKIQQTIKKALSGKTVIMITHRLSLASNADKVVILENGAIVEQGNPEKLLQEGNHYWKLTKDQIEEAEIIQLSRHRVAAVA